MISIGLFPVLYSAWNFCRPGGNFDAQWGGIALWLLCGAAWGIRLVVFLAIGWFYGRPESDGFKVIWRWAALPCAFLLWIVVCISSDLLLHGAFDVSRGDLETLALRGSTGPQGERAGVLWVERVDRVQDGVLLMTGTGYDACPYGYAWFPRSKPQDREDLRFHEFDGSWYFFWAARAGYVGTPSPASQPASPIAP